MLRGVQVFLDDPDQGGIAVNSGFRVTVQIPASANGAEHLPVVATRSLAGNRLGEVAVPIAVGALTPLPRLVPMP